MCYSVSVPVGNHVCLAISGRQGLDDAAAVRGVLVPGCQDGGDLRSSVSGPAGEMESNADAYRRPFTRPETLFLITVVALDPVGQQVGDARYVFEAKTIQRMELLVLSTLKWRMQAVTPFSYIDYFLHRLNGGGGDAPSRRAVLRSAELILCIARGEHASRKFPRIRRVHFDRSDG